jgi:hypothetical protein
MENDFFLYFCTENNFNKFLIKNCKKMIENTETRYAGNAPAAGSLARSQAGRQTVAYSRNIRRIIMCINSAKRLGLILSIGIFVLFSSCKSEKNEYISFINALEEETDTGIYEASIKLKDYIASRLKRPLRKNPRFIEMICGRVNSGEARKKEKFAIIYTLYDVFLVNGKGNGDGNDPFYPMNDLDADKYALICKTFGNFLVNTDIDNDGFWLWVKSIEPAYENGVISSNSCIFEYLLFSVFKYYSKDDIVVLLDRIKAALDNSTSYVEEWKNIKARPGRFWLYSLSPYALEYLMDRALSLELFPFFVSSELFNIHFETQYILDSSVKNAQDLKDLLSNIAEITQKLNSEALKSYQRHFRLPETFADDQAHYLHLQNMEIKEHQDLKSLLSVVSQNADKGSDKPRYLIVLVQASKQDNDKTTLQIPVALMLALGADRIPSSVSEVNRILVFKTSYSRAFTYLNGSEGYRCTVVASIVDAKTGRKLNDLGRQSNDPPERIHRYRNNKSGEFAPMNTGFIFKTLAKIL